jgi:hypothetical protein
LINQGIVERTLFLDTDDGTRQGRLSLETARLSEGFFEALKRHPIPLEEAAIRALSNNSAALDCYLWLAYRLHALHQPRLITWIALKVHMARVIPYRIPLQGAVFGDSCDGLGGLSGGKG